MARLLFCSQLVLILSLTGCGQRGVLPDQTQPPGTDVPRVDSEDIANWPEPPSDEPEVRIRFAVRSHDAEAPFKLGVVGQRLLLLDGANRRPYLLDAPVLVVGKGTGWSVQDASDGMIELPHLGPLSIRTLGGRREISFEGKQLPGALELIPQPKDPSKVDLVTRVGMERYLPGVLQGELFGSWPLATFQAQAVAARSYAVAEAAFWGPRRHYDLVAGPASQAWSGLETSDRARAAVESTQGIVLLFDGRVIPAYYSSSCGGRSASAHEAISDRPAHRIPPLQARTADAGPCCEKASVRTWTLAFDLDAVAVQTTTWGKERGDASLEGLGRLRSITLIDSNAVGRPLLFELTGARGGRAQVSADTLRRILGRVPQADGTSPAQVRSNDLQPSIRGRRLLVSGSGYGHGVGLCQYGARTMADDGSGWQAILQRYYPGAKPTKAWPSPGS
jgi:stage II sporulation protein D